MELKSDLQLQVADADAAPQLSYPEAIVRDNAYLGLACSRRDYLMSFRLVYVEYFLEKYVSQDMSLYYNIYHLLPSTFIYLYKLRNCLKATMTCVKDTNLFGLPMDALYKVELDALREQGRRLVECCSFASSRKDPCRHPVLHMQRAFSLNCLANDLTDICITVNPKHVSFYERMYHFEVMGEERFYPKVGAPAVAMRLNLDTYRQRFCTHRLDDPRAQVYKGYCFLKETHNHPLFFSSKRLGTTEATYLPDRWLAAWMLQRRPDLVAGLNGAQRHFLRGLYGDLPQFAQIH